MDSRRQAAKILTAYYKPNPGGLCTRYFRAIRALLARGCVVHYIAIEPFPIEHERCHWHRLWWPQGMAPRGALFWTWLHLTLPWLAAYLGLHYKIRHAFAFSLNYGALFLPLRLLRRIEYSLFLRADTRRNHEIKGGSPIIRFLDAQLEAAAIWRARVYPVSDALGYAVRRRHPLVNAASWQTLRNDAPAACSRAPTYIDGPFRIGFVGVIENRKRPEFLIDLLALLDDETIELHFFGSGPMESPLADQAKRAKTSNRVQFHGWVEPNLIWSRIHLLLHPSLHEGSPNAVLESLSAGCPVIASDIPEHRELLPPNMIASPHDSCDWRDKILAARDFHSESQAAADSAARRLAFDWEQQISQAIMGAGDYP